MSYLSFRLVVNKLGGLVQVLLLHVEPGGRLPHHGSGGGRQLPCRGPDGDISCWWLQHLEAAEIK